MIFNHKKSRDGKGNSVCETVLKCLKCNKSLKYADVTRQEHARGMSKCRNCEMMPEHQCYMKGKCCKGAKGEKDCAEKYMFLDFE